MAITQFEANEIVSRANVNQRITQMNAYFPVSIANGGTGGTSATGARTNLDIYTKQTIYDNSSGSSGTITLTESADNFSWLVIYFGWSGIWNSVITKPSSNVSTNISTSYMTGDYNQLYVRSALIDIIGNSVTFKRNKTSCFNIGSNSSSKNEYLTIFKIDGFKH